MHNVVATVSVFNNQEISIGSDKKCDTHRTVKIIGIQIMPRPCIIVITVLQMYGGQGIGG